MFDDERMVCQPVHIQEERWASQNTTEPHLASLVAAMQEVTGAGSRALTRLVIYAAALAGVLNGPKAWRVAHVCAWCKEAEGSPGLPSMRQR